jgi:TnpA family transposase
LGGDSLNANYSYKYFGRGSTVYDFIDERFANFYLAVISSSEREASFLLDGLFSNEVNSIP